MNTNFNKPTASIFLYRSVLGKVATSAFQDTFSQNFPYNAQTAFNYARDIWSFLIQSRAGAPPIKVFAIWDTIKKADGTVDSLVLARTTVPYIKKFQNAPDANMYYPLALAEDLSDSNFKNTLVKFDMTIRFNSFFTNWYFGTDLNTPDGQYDFVSVALHEIAHRLGFSHSFEDSAGIARRKYFSEKSLTASAKIRTLCAISL